VRHGPITGLPNVSSWHLADIDSGAEHVRLVGESGQCLNRAPMSTFDPIQTLRAFDANPIKHRLLKIRPHETSGRSEVA